MGSPFVTSQRAQSRFLHMKKKGEQTQTSFNYSKSSDFLEMQEQHGRTCCVLVNQLARSNPPPFFGFESWETAQSWKPLSLNAAQGTSPNRFLEDSQLSAWSFCSAVSAVRQVRPQGVIINVPRGR